MSSAGRQLRDKKVFLVLLVRGGPVAPSRGQEGKHIVCRSESLLMDIDLSADVSNKRKELMLRRCGEEALGGFQHLLQQLLGRNSARIRP